jgi:RimJ/RimL family protein N-acetyltransferase/predicted enzyme related to lactoylglutathione lyase
MEIHFQPLNAADFEQLRSWQSELHVKEVWQARWLSSPETYRESLGSDSVRRFLILDAQKLPMGFAQYYWAAQVGGGWWHGIDNQTVGFDFFIGEKSYLGKGYGKRIVSEFITKLFSVGGVELVIADPKPENRKMIHVLKSCGFSSQGKTVTPDGEVELMSITKPLNIQSFATIRLSTNDFAKSRKWYIDFLGQNPIEDIENFASFRIQGVSLDISAADAKSPSSTGGSVGYWLVSELQPVIERALKRGATIYRGPLEVVELSRTIVQIKDPCGNVIGFEAPVKE